MIGTALEWNGLECFNVMERIECLWLGGSAIVKVLSIMS